jgi:hydroxyacylglutathione hydrolase
MEIKAIPTLKDNYVWVMIDSNQHSAIIVDPGEATPVIAFLKQHHLSLLAILITHHHWDHTNGITEILHEFPAPVYGPANEAIAEMTKPLQDNTTFHIPGFPEDISVIAIPGHTSGHIAYHVANALFCGDTLFAAGCGRLFEGTATQMAASLQKITSLPDDTQIYCAHEYTLNNLRFAQTVEPNNQEIAKRIQRVTELRNNNQPSLPSTLNEEKATNPFLRCDSAELKASVEKQTGVSPDNTIAVFTALRKWKDIF